MSRSARNERPFLRRLGLVASLVSLSLAASVSPAVGSVTIGQLAAPGSTAGCIGASGSDRAQATVTSGNSYLAPGAGTITSWSHQAAAGAGQELAMKVFRKVSEPAKFSVVGHDGPRSIAAGVVNTFPASVPVKAGDVLGLSTSAGIGVGCRFDVPGDSALTRDGNLPDGGSGDFDPDVDSRLNITAVFVPSNSFSLSRITRNKRRGTSTVVVEVPNPGELIASGKGVKVSGLGAVTRTTITAPGEVKLTIKARGKAKRKLGRTGRVKVKPKITYTPTGGDPSTQSVKVKLKKTL